MDLSHLPPLRDVITSAKLVAHKSLGQNFLLDLNLTDRIARSAGDLTDTHVIEIGPGPGGLTRALLSQGARQVTAIEYDPRVIRALHPLQQAAQGQLKVIEADALKTSLLDLCGGNNYAIVANLPYNIATVLLVQWIESRQSIQSMTLMFQREVAERLVAEVNTSAYGRLSVLVQCYFKVKILFHIPPSAFVPAPKVISSVVSFTPYPTHQNVNITALQSVLRAAFGQRRKMLRSSLKNLLTDVSTTLEHLNIDPMRRAETLTLEEFIKISRSILI